MGLNLKAGKVFSREIDVKYTKCVALIVYVKLILVIDAFFDCFSAYVRAMFFEDAPGWYKS